MKNSLYSSIFLLGLFLLSSFTIAPDAHKTETNKIKWISLEEAFTAVQQAPRKTVIDVYTDWCGWCKKMDKATFGHSAIAKYVDDNYYAVKLDAEMKEDVAINGKTYKYVPHGRSGAHELAIILLDNMMSFPSVVVLDEKFNKLTIVPGFLDAPKMDKVLRYFADGYHSKGVKWQAFDDEFVSKIEGGSSSKKPTKVAKSNRRTKAKKAQDAPPTSVRESRKRKISRKAPQGGY